MTKEELEKTWAPSQKAAAWISRMENETGGKVDVDRPVRRGLLLCVHGGQPRDGAQPRVRRTVRPGSGSPRALRAIPSSLATKRTGHRGHPCCEGKRRRGALRRVPGRLAPGGHRQKYSDYIRYPIKMLRERAAPSRARTRMRRGIRPGVRNVHRGRDAQQHGAHLEA